MLSLGGAPKFKAKKYPKDEIQDLIGEVVGSVRYAFLVVGGYAYISTDTAFLCIICRYDTLHITSDVNVRYNSETGGSNLAVRMDSGDS